MARYWFTPKRYGYGATPLTWQGWAFTGGTIAVILALTAVMPAFIERAGPWGWLVWATILAGVLVAVTSVVQNGRRMAMALGPRSKATRLR